MFDQQCFRTRDRSLLTSMALLVVMRGALLLIGRLIDGFVDRLVHRVAFLFLIGRKITNIVKIWLDLGT